MGNPFYKEALHRSQDGLLAAELSGHIMFAEHHAIDDALYAALKLLAARACFGGARIQDIDGITVEYPDWWFNLRASHTEPVAKLVIEAASPAALAARREEVQRALGVSLP